MIGILMTPLDDNDKSFILDLYKNYYNLARKIIFNLTHSYNDMEDLIDEVFVKLIEKITLLRTFDSYKTTTYITYTIRSVAINYIKRKNIENKHILYHEDMDNIDDLYLNEVDFDDNLIHKEELATLSNAIMKLPQSQKDLLYFKYMLEMRDKDIADILGIAPNSVREYLTRARRNAKSLMKKELKDNA